MKNHLDMIGRIYGRLTVVSQGANDNHGKLRWNCLCECGNMSLTGGSTLRKGAANSCGCLSREIASARQKTHGESKTVEYKVFYGMLKRCKNPNAAYFNIYGARGISVCAEWDCEGGYERFLAHVGRRPSPKHSIDRIDVNRGYESGNVKWSTGVEQGQNQRPCKRNVTGVRGIEVKGNKWVAAIGLPIRRRLRLGTFTDFFEACCARKSAENEYWRNAA